MLACLPGPGDLSLQLLPHTQMTSGPPQRWDTTQRMRSAPFPTPAELDAYAKKVALQPLTIKIFPSSVKVPQRNHVRRTVNGLDTQRYSPYPPSQAGARSGLLAVAAAARGHAPKALLKDYDGSRSRSHPEGGMNPPPTGPYQGTPPSTLAHLHPHHLHHHRHDPPQGPPQSLGLGHPPPAAQHPQGPARPPHPQGHPPHPPALLLHPQQPCPPGARKLPEGDAPPNVTVSTSTIPVSMATAIPPQGGPQADLSAIVHQISRFCQARAHAATSMCEGQITNPSPISRSLLINACSRASYLHPSELHPHGNPPPGYHGDVKPHPLQLHMHPRPRPWSQPPLAHLQGGGGFPCEGPGYHPPEACVGRPYSLKPPTERPTPSPPVLLHNNNNNNVHTGGPCHMTCHMTHYSGGAAHYFTPGVWNSSILPTPNSDSSGSQDLGLPFHGGAPPSSSSTTTGLDCGPPGGAAHYRPGAPSAQTHLMQAPDYLGGDFQTPYLPDPNLGLMGATHRVPGGRVGPGDGEACSLLLQHPGYR